jgi:hypothetical protein
MDQLTYQYLFTGLTVLFWLSPIILSAIISIGYCLLKNRNQRNFSMTIVKKKHKGLPTQAML